MFRLNDTQQSAIRSVGKLEEINEYSLRGLSVSRIKPNGSIGSNDSQYIFNIDSAVLSGNIPLNLFEATIKYKVECTGKVLPVLANYDVGSRFCESINPTSPYLMSPSNGAMDAFCINKSFSTIDMTDQNTNLVQETRNPERISILSRLLNQDYKEQHGIYESNGYGSYTQKYGGTWELLPVFDTVGANVIQPNAYMTGCSPQEVCKSVFWKRNTNSRYIVPGPSTYTGATTSAPRALGSILPSDWTYINMAEFRIGADASDLTFNPRYELADIPANTLVEVDVTQTQEFTVVEDIMHDVLVTRYGSQNAVSFPTNQLVLTFTKSDRINSLYKTSNKKISDVKVTIVDFYLTIMTFNYGLINIPAEKEFNMGFFSEVTDQEQFTLSSVVEKKQIVTQQRQYNSVPLYLMCYTNVQNSSTISANRSDSFQPAKHNSVRLSLGFDSGNPLYSMTVDEIKEKTLRNLGETWSNEQALFSHVPLPAGRVQNLARGSPQFLGKFGLAEILSANPDPTGMSIVTAGTCASVDRSLLDGLILLRLGTDIRLPPDLVPGLNRKVSFTWHFDFAPVDNEYASYTAGNEINCTFYSTAFFPSEYIISPNRGLVRGGNITISEDTFTSMYMKTNESLLSRNPANELFFTAKSPLIVGSGFASILEMARARLPMVRNIAHSIATLASNVSGQFDSDLARKIKSGADTALAFLGNEPEESAPTAQRAVKKTVVRKGRPLKIRSRK